MPIQVRPLHTVEDWNAAYEASSGRPLLLLKISTRCPVSSGAHEEFMNYIEDAADPPFDTVIVRVLEERPVSNAVTETLGLEHASPQVILIQDRKVVWHASHWDITYSSLEQHLGQHCEK